MRPDDALARVQAPLVLLLDCDLDAAQSDLFFARTTKPRSAVVLFGTPTNRHDVVGLAHRRSVPWVRLPTSRTALTEAIEAAIASAMHAGMWSVAAGLLVGALAIMRLPLPV